MVIQVPVNNGEPTWRTHLGPDLRNNVSEGGNLKATHSACPLPTIALSVKTTHGGAFGHFSFPTGKSHLIKHKARAAIFPPKRGDGR